MKEVNALQDFETFLETHSDVPMNDEWPHISCERDDRVEDGFEELNLWWSLQLLWIDLGFRGDGTYSFYSKYKFDDYMGDDIPVTERLPDDIVEAIIGEINDQSPKNTGEDNIKT